MTVLCRGGNVTHRKIVSATDCDVRHREDSSLLIENIGCYNGHQLFIHSRFDTHNKIVNFTNTLATADHSHIECEVKIALAIKGA